VMIVLALILMGCTNRMNTNQENKVTISIEHAKGEISQSKVINNLVHIENNTERNIHLYIQSELIDLAGKVFASNMEDFDISMSESRVIQVKMLLNDEIATGRYKTKITVWEEDPKIKETKYLEQSISEQEIIFFQHMDNFEFLDEAVWDISNKQLGKTLLKEENVYIKDGYLGVSLTKNKLEGGELYTLNKYGYGIYEIRMKLPLAQSTITGFFMYASPDYFYEIDMEIYNDSSGTLLLTTYAEGDVRNSKKYLLGFDATKEFHNYRFDYVEDNIKFYVDNQFIDEFESGIPKAEMQLMVNCWYPEWLGLAPKLEEEELLIDWIKY